MINLKIDSKSSIPIYYQIYDQIKHKIVCGELQLNAKLPTIRELAVNLEINPNTVSKAYNELQREGLIDTVQGVGTYVKGFKENLRPIEREKKLVEIINKFLDEAFRYGFTKEEIINYLRR